VEEKKGKKGEPQRHRDTEKAQRERVNERAWKRRVDFSGLARRARPILSSL